MTITVVNGDITLFSCDAIVNPANSSGIMGGGVAGALKRVGGQIIEEEARQHAPIPVGSAVATTAGSLPARYVIHAPTMTRPAMHIRTDNVEKATKAAFQLGKQLGIGSIVLPGMGTGVGGVSVDDAARVMISVASMYSSFFDRIVFIDRSSRMCEAFSRYLSEYK